MDVNQAVFALPCTVSLSDPLPVQTLRPSTPPDTTPAGQQEAMSQNPASCIEALETINADLRAWDTNLRFHIDPELQRLVVSIVDAENGEVLRTVPGEAMLRIAKMLARLQGQIISTTA